MPRFNDDYDDPGYQDADFQLGGDDDYGATEDYDPDAEFDPDAEPEPEDEYEEDELDARIARAVNKAKSQMGQSLGIQRTALRAAGLDIVDGQVVAIDPQRAAAIFQGAGANAEAEEEDELGDMPDPTLDPPGFADWLDKRDERNRRAMAADLQVVAEPVARRAMTDALTLSRDVLPVYNLGHLLDHPKFEETMAKALRDSKIPQSKWNDEQTLASVAGFINATLVRSMPKRGARGRQEESERPVVRRTLDRPDVARSALARNGYSQVGSSRAGGRTGGGGELSREDQMIMQRLRVTPEQYAALGNERGDAYARTQQRRAPKPATGRSGRRSNRG